MKWDCSKHPKGLPYPPPHAQMASVDQAANEHTNFEEDAILVQQLKQLGFSHTTLSSHSQTLKVTLAHSGMTSNYFIALKPSWIVDSGATNHMTGNKSILSELSTTS